MRLGSSCPAWLAGLEGQMSKLEVRPIRLDDTPAVAGLITELGYPTVVEAMASRLTAILADPDYATFVAERDRVVVGVAGVAVDWFYERDGRYGRLLVLVVSSTARGAGIGSRLVDTVERWAADRGARGIVVNSALHRHDTHGFYERRGYARTGFRFVKPLG
jgi:GNAT superfamily N-acetyltransferase